MPEKTNNRKALILALKIIISALAIYIIYRKVELKTVTAYLMSANALWLIAAFAVFFISKSISALRLNLFFKQNGVELNERQNLFLYLTGMFYNLFLPLIGGEAYKIYFIRQRQDIPLKSLLWASLHDRLSGLIALSALALVYFMCSSFSFPYKPLALLLIPGGYAGYYIVLRYFFKEYMPVFTSTNILSLLVQLTQILCSYCILMSLHVNANITDYLFIFLLSCYAYIIPIMGAREMAFVFGAQVMHLDINMSLAISLFFYLSLATTSLSGMFFIFFPKSLEN